MLIICQPCSHKINSQKCFIRSYYVFSSSDPSFLYFPVPFPPSSLSFPLSFVSARTVTSVVSRSRGELEIWNVQKLNFNDVFFVAAQGNAASPAALTTRSWIYWRCIWSDQVLPESLIFGGESSFWNLCVQFYLFFFFGWLIIAFSPFMRLMSRYK